MLLDHALAAFTSFTLDFERRDSPVVKPKDWIESSHRDVTHMPQTIVRLALLDVGTAGHVLVKFD